MTTRHDSGDEAQYLVRKLLTLGTADLALSHPWLLESDRWKELVFALMTRVVGLDEDVVGLDEDQVREITQTMHDLGLLDVGVLASISEEARTPDSNHPYARHIREFLQENGLTPEQAQRGLITICEAALGLQNNFDGKVQHYLRKYGELMVAEIGRTFKFSELMDTDVAFAFTYWLQNVSNMPLSLLDANVLTFCEQHHLTSEQLIAAADELDVNLALLDDLVQYYLARFSFQQMEP